MEKLTFDSGVREFEINGNGVLRFNPSDPNVYARLLDAMDDIKAVEGDFSNAVKETQQDDVETVLRLMAQADKQMKGILTNVFGRENDFDEILGGVNVMAVAGNGELVITNLINALSPIIQDGTEKYTNQQVDAAVEEAQAARASRGKK